MTIAVESTEAGNGAPPREGKIGLKGAYVLFALLLVYTLNFIDRTIIGALAEPIKTDLQLSDWQVGLLGGLAFSLFYSILGIPIARLAEQYSRVRIISTAVALWSIMTAVCGLATNFTQLLLFRLGVGVGEAGCTPPAHSLISGLFSAVAARNSVGHLFAWHSDRTVIRRHSGWLDRPGVRVAPGLHDGWITRRGDRHLVEIDREGA